MSITDKIVGFATGCRIAGQRSKQKTITGYSYNGVVLPTLPEWDKETYPYAYIWQTSSGKYSAVFVSAPLYYNSGMYSDGVVSYLAYEGITAEGEWGERVVSGNYSVGVAVTLVWCNQDTMNEDGTLYLAASDPIPVYA